uniref:hypothetical protein n=1 Tax=Gracilaria urvillei TaxID=172974 RepID=UPI001D111A9C|nr:hypothetical protein LK147_pgp172 [Hydropuntia urvillei]UAD88368.1 hypothetical protein [Hydropuntia urvillei]
MFELYIITLICFLLPLCYFITNNIKSIYKQINTLNNIKGKKNKIHVKNEYILYVTKTYISRKKWLHCITMLDFYTEQCKTDDNTIIANYYNYIGLCYQCVHLDKIAKKYYLKAYNKEPISKQALKKLNNIQGINN